MTNIDDIDLDALHAKLVGLGAIPPSYTVERRLVAYDLTSHSLAGAQMKISATYRILVLDEAGTVVGRISPDD